MKKYIFIIPLVLISAMAGAFFVWQGSGQQARTDATPLPRMYGSTSPSPMATVNNSSLPKATGPAALSEVNLAVPFTIQAPHQNWEDPYGDFCEEASVLMAASYVKNLTIPSADFADQKMNEIKDFEIKRFGYHKDTTAEETAIILKEFYKLDKVKTVYDPSEETIKKALADGKVVIIPAAGRKLGNPNFRAPGPLYHMLVIKGYRKDGNFITNDPGTRNGADYIYTPGVIMNAIHDWNGGDVDNGRKVIIVVG